MRLSQCHFQSHKQAALFFSFFLPFHHFSSFAILFFPSLPRHQLFLPQELLGSTQEAGSSTDLDGVMPVMPQETSIDVKLCPFIGGQGWSEGYLDCWVVIWFKLLNGVELMYVRLLSSLVRSECRICLARSLPCPAYSQDIQRLEGQTTKMVELEFLDK